MAGGLLGDSYRTQKTKGLPGMVVQAFNPALGREAGGGAS